MKFECDGPAYDSLEEAIEEHGEEDGARRYIKDNCGNTLDAPSKTGMGHVGVVASDFRCDECGKHYTAAEARAKARNQRQEAAQ